MPRIRSIKPEFWTSGQVLECSRNARLLFIGLWNFCDDHGRHPLRAKQIKAEVFPADDLSPDDVLEMLRELSTNGLIQIYTVDSVEYLQIKGWHHQRIDKRQDPKYPAPLDEHSTNIPRTLPPDRIGRDRIGRDRIGEDGTAKTNGANAPSASAVRFDEFWTVYPKKREKKKSREIWKRKKLDAKADEIIDDVVMRDEQDSQWRDGYIPNPTTYLRGERWEDEITKPRSVAKEAQEYRIQRKRVINQ